MSGCPNFETFFPGVDGRDPARTGVGTVNKNQTFKGLILIHPDTPFLRNSPMRDFFEN